MRLLATANLRAPGSEKRECMTMYIAKDANSFAEGGKPAGKGHDALKTRLRWRIRRARRMLEERAGIQSEPVRGGKP
jgi:hypothetical protein